MRTLSARIVLGFAVLITAFGVITGTLVRNANSVEDQVHMIGSGYMPLALDIKDLVLHEDALTKYLNDGLADETQPGVARNHLKLHVAERAKALGAAADALNSVRDLSDLDPADFWRINESVTALSAQAATADLLYAQLYRKIPIGAAAIAGDATLAEIREAEAKFTGRAKDLGDNVRNLVVTTTGQLEHNEHTLRLRTIYLGAGAVALGLLVAAWAVLTLRPLARLRATARRVAGGDYKSQIEERGPAEVADLAREFNSMGRAIEERERELVRSERLAAVGKMAAMITHEVRNPLSSIGLNTELLEDELAPNADEARALCRAITHEVDRLTAITEEYLAFARLPKPKIAAEPITPLVAALAAFVREDLAARKVELVVEAAAGDPVALVDPAQLRQCLVNLVRNAADAVASKGGGHVWIRTRRADGRVAIEVADDGIGIAPELLPKLFDQFFSTKDGGSGLGLALTQQIVKDHGGEIAVSSVVGQGTTFTVTVPAG